MPFLPVDHQANGSIAANAQTVILDVTRHAVATVTLTGTWVGTIQFEVTTDNVTWVGIPVTPVAGGATVTSATANGTWSVYVSAYAAVRLRASAWTSGSVAVAIRASAAGGSLTALTAGSIVFANASGVLAQDSNLFWDGTNHRLGIGNAGPATTLDVAGNMRIQGTGGLGLGGGTPAHYLDIQASDSIKSGVFVNHTNTAANASGSYPITVTDTILTTGLGSGFTGVGSGVKHLLFYGDTTTPTAATGTVGCFTGQIHVRNSAVQQNEYSILTGFLTMENNDNAFGNTTPGRAWGTDMNIHGPITTQPSALSGFHMVLTNRFNGNPADAMSGAYWALTGFGLGGGYTAPLAAATTFPVQVGFGVAGTSGSAFPGTGQGFVTAFQAGDSVATPGGKAGNWAVVNSRIGYGLTAKNYDTAAIWIDTPYTGVAAPGIVIAQGTVTGAAITAPLQVGAATIANTQNTDVPVAQFGIGVATGNAPAFGLHAFRSVAGSDATGVAMILGVDIGATSRLGSHYLTWGANGSGIGINTPTPNVDLHIVGTTKFQGTSGETATVQFVEELLTLSTVGTTTDTAANLLPANAEILSVTARVTTTITTATNWSVGDATTAARFISAQSTLTAGTTVAGLNHLNGAAAGAAAAQLAAAKVRVTTTGTPGAGVIRIAVAYILFTAPSS